MQEVKDWLESKEREYSRGLGLLGKYSKNRILIQNLARKARPDKLIYELEKICSREKIIVNTAEVSLPAFDSPVLGKITELIKSKPVLLYSQLPDHIKTLRKENIEKYKIARALHEKAKLVKTAEERKVLLEDLEETRVTIFKNWEFLDKYMEENNPNTDSKSPEIIIDIAKIDDKRIKANRKYLTEGKERVPKLSGTALSLKIEAMQRRVNELLLVKASFTEKHKQELEKIGISFNG